MAVILSLLTDWVDLNFIATKTIVVLSNHACSLVTSLLCKVVPTGFLPKDCERGVLTEGLVPPRVQWEGPHDRGADYLSPQHYTVFHNRLACQTTAVKSLMCVFAVWPYYSRVNMKDPGGCNTKL